MSHHLPPLYRVRDVDGQHLLQVHHDFPHGEWKTVKAYVTDDAAHAARQRHIAADARYPHAHLAKAHRP